MKKEIDILPFIYNPNAVQKIQILDYTKSISIENGSWLAQLSEIEKINFTINKSLNPTLIFIYNCKTIELFKEEKFFNEIKIKLNSNHYKKIIVFQNEMNWDTYSELSDIENFFFNIFRNDSRFILTRNIIEPTYMFTKINAVYNIGFFPFHIWKNYEEIKNIDRKNINKKWYLFTTNSSKRNNREKLYDLFEQNNFWEKVNSSFLFKTPQKRLHFEDTNSFDLKNLAVKDCLSSIFQVVLETRTDSECGLSLSEKTFKALLYGTPFLLHAQVNTLKYLRKIGFITFQDFFDESYDNENNEEIRLQKIFKELSKKMDKEIIELEKEYQKNIHITDNNLNTAVSYSKNEIKKIIELF